MPRIRTGYSFRTAAGKINDVLVRLMECGYPAAPITDRASTFGWVRWAQLCGKLPQNDSWSDNWPIANLKSGPKKENNPRIGPKPVFGVEIGVAQSISAKKPIIDYWTFIAKDSIGPINRLIDTATEQFRYEPLLTYDQAQSVDAFKIVGHRAILSEVSQDYDLFVGIGPGVSKGYARAALQTGLQPIRVSNNFYIRPEDQGFYEVLVGRGANTQTYDQHIQTLEEWADSVSYIIDHKIKDKAIKNFHWVLDQSNATLNQATLIKPEKGNSLFRMCLDGALALKCDITDPIYKERLDYELNLIAEKQYEDYFYIVADICNWARDRMVVGPARGSSCGSLVCFLLGITTVDPIPHGLIFERFIDINRDDLPDIDIDFSDQNRQMVFDYISEKYGPEHVARLGTVAMYQPRSALREAGAALNVPRWKCDAVAESLIERSTGDSRALQTLEDTLKTMPAGIDLLNDHPEMIVAAKMEGHPRHYSQHAAGVVLSVQPINDYVATDHRSGATMCDKKDAEDLNLLKIDALGLTQLSVFEDALKLSNLPLDTLERLSLDDPEAFKVLNDGKFSGIFQFNGMALQSITKQFTVKEFDDIVSVTALGRPGPLASGGAHEWIRRKIGTNPITYPHPIFKPHLQDTLGIVLYQEQVMNIGREIGDLSWGDVTALRKAMSRSLGKEYFDQFGNPWKKGAIAKGVDPKDADDVWDDLCAYGAWSFNKSHSVAYGLISYWCCWLKAHHPFEFAAATLSHEDDPSRQIQLLREMVAEGYTYIPIDPDISDIKWGVRKDGSKRTLIGPLSNAHGIGPKTVQAIIGARGRGEPIPESARKKLDNAKTPIDSLWPIRDAFQRIMPDPAERNIHTPPREIIDVQIKKQDQTVLVFCTLSKINPRDENEVVIVARRGYKIDDGLTASLNLQLTDDTDTIFGKIDRWKYPKMGKAIVDYGRPGKALYAVKGRVRGDSGFRMILIQNIRHIGDIDD